MSEQASTAPAGAAVYDADAAHTYVTFEVVHFGTSTVRARFDNVTGEVNVDPTAKRGTVDIDIDTTSVNSGLKLFDGHLRDERFFNTAKFPRAHFTADTFKFADGAVRSVSGDLTLIGQTHPVTLTATRFNGYANPLHHAWVYGGDFEATIQRSAWGMTWGLDIGVPDAVHLLVSIEAVHRTQSDHAA